MRITHFGPDDDRAALDASGMFDELLDAAATERFLSAQGHHLLIAYDDATPMGFVSGVEMTHPDKGTEMFLYELSVAEPFRGRGVATALIEQLVAVAKAAGCYGMWVLTDDANEAALEAYTAAGGEREPKPSTLLVWTFG